MSLFWGDRIVEDIEGLDILGVRRIDQAIEGALVNGITTISNRVRYIPIMTWAIGAFFDWEIREGGDAAAFDKERQVALQRFLRRVELLVLAATTVDAASTDKSGMLGTQNNGKKMADLKAGAAIPFPEVAGEALVGTYFGPASALGLVASAPAHASVPYFLTPRGQMLFKARQEVLADSPVVEVLREGEVLDVATAKQAVPFFSLGAIDQVPEEARLMKEAMFKAWQAPNVSGAARVEKAYRQFGDTVAWIRQQVSQQALRPNEIIARNYGAACQGSAHDGVAVRWAEFEWRRRCHYALEMILSAVTVSLGILKEAPLEDIVSAWRAETADAKALLDLWKLPDGLWRMTVAEVVASVPPDLLLGQPVSTDRLNRLEAGEKAIMAFGILSAAAAQTRELRGKFSAQSGPGEEAIAMVEDRGADVFEAFMLALAERTVVMPHLGTTYRKMGAGMACSLRFYREGRVLCATGTVSSPGYSGDRLSNVMRMLADAGVLANTQGGYVDGERATA